MDNTYKTPADLEICILTAAYTIYCELADEPLSESAFRQKFTANAPKFADLVRGVSEK